MVKGPTHTNLIFDLVTPYDKHTTSSDILRNIQDEFKKEDDSINLVVTVEHSFI